MNRDKFKEKLSEFADLKLPETHASLGIEIKKLKPRLAECELGCGKIVKDQIIEKQLMTYPIKHTRIRCADCCRCPHPNGEGFIHQNSFQSEFKKFLDKKDK